MFPIHGQVLTYRHRLMVLAVLVCSTLLSLALIGVRWAVAGHPKGAFLVWNLFLAWVPFWFALGLYALHLRGTRRPWVLLFLGAAWLLFFPNAPYLWTDIVHLFPRSHYASFWCDLVLILTFGWNGMLLGLLSLYLIHRVAADRLGLGLGWATAIASLALGSFGISLGRFDRLNSWDGFTHPAALFSRLGDAMLHPFPNRLHLTVAALFFAFLFLAYLTLLALTVVGAESDGSHGGYNLFSSAPRPHRSMR
jgi:uncharacterized membrane protein